MKAKKFKKISAVFALSLTLAGTAASVCLPLLSVQAEGKNMIKGTQVKALTTEQQVLDAVKAAKAAGVTVNEKGRATKTVASKDYDATKKAVSDGYAQQIKTLNERTTKQKEQDAKYQKELADWNAKYNNSNDASDVVDPNTLIQKLVLNAEPDAKMNVKNLNPDKATGRMLDKKVVDPGFQTVYGTGNNSTGHDDQVLGAYAMASKDTKSVDGNIGEVTYTNLKHSEYDGKKIVKIVITFSNLKSGLIHNEVNGGHPSVLAAADPTVTLSYFNSDGITYTPKYYTEDGKQVNFSQRHAYLSFGSLNSNGPGKTIEKAQVVDGGKAVGFSGSSVTAHKDGWLYSDKSNDYGYIPEEFKGWDDIKSPKAAYGAGLVDIKTNKLAINYAVNSKVYVWARASTTIPQSIVPPKPVKPAPLKADYQFTDIKVTSDKPTKTADKEGNLVLTGDVITQHISQNTGIGNDNTKYWIGDAIFYGKDGKLPVKYSLKDFTITNSKGKDVSGLFKLTESEGTVTNKKARLIKATPIDGKKLADDTYTLNAKETAIGDIAADKITDVGISMAGNTGEHYYPQLDPKAQKHWTDGNKTTDGKQYVVGDSVEATVSSDYPDQSKLANKVTKIGLVDDYSNFAKYVDYKSSKVFEGTKNVTSEYTITNKDGKVTALRKEPTKATAGKAKLVTTFKIKADVPTGTVFKNKGQFILNNTNTPSPDAEINVIKPKAEKHWTDGNKTTDGKQYLVGDLAEATVSSDYPDQSKLANKVTKIGLVDDYSNFVKYVDYKSSKVFEGAKDVTSEYTITNKDGKVTALRKDPTKAVAGKAKLVATFKIKADVPTGTVFKNKGQFILNNTNTPSPEAQINVIKPKAEKHWTDGDKSTDGKKYMAGELADATVSTDYPDQSKLADKITKLGLIDDYSNFAKYVEYKSSKVFEGTKDVTSEYTITNKDNKVMALRKDPTKAAAGKAKLVTTFKIKDNVPNGTTFTNAGSFILNGITTPTTKPKIETYDPKAIKDVEAGTVKGETDATIDKKEVKKGDKLTYILGSNDLPANRKDDIKSHVSKDTLPKEVEYNGFKAYLPDGKGSFTDVTKDVTLKADTTKHNLEFTEGKALLDGYNKDKTKATKTVIIDVYVTAKQDGSAFNNTYTLLTNGHADTSNKVENRTPNAKQPEKPSKPETPNKPEMPSKPETPNKPELPQTGSAVGKTTLWDFIKNLF